ncbi:glycosyltransferase, partial [Bacillus cereus]
PIPSFLYSLPSNQPVIYFAMGSSGSKEIIMKFLHILKKLPVTVICPMKKILASSGNIFSSSKNIILCDLLPAHK